MTTIEVDQEVAAAYQAVRRIVADNQLPVRVEDPTQLPHFPTDFMALIAASAPAYVVELSVHLGFVTVSRTGRFGFGNDHTYVNYPSSHTASDFTEQLAAAVLPVVRRELELATAEKAVDYAEHGPSAAYEARDAVQRVDPPELVQLAEKGRCGDCGDTYASCCCFDDESL